MHSSLTTPFDLDRISKSPTAATTSMTLGPETVDLNFNFDLTYKYLRELAERNCEYFSQQKTDVCRRFERLLIQIIHSLDLSVPLVKYLTENFHHFDYSPEVRPIISAFILIILFSVIDSCEWLSNISCITWSSMFTNIRYTSTS
jgi:hypothetical protein